MLTGEDLPDNLFSVNDTEFQKPRKPPLLLGLPCGSPSEEEARDAAFALMVSPAVLWLAYCRQLYRIWP
jgi:hypothetical protein